MPTGIYEHHKKSTHRCCFCKKDKQRKEFRELPSGELGSRCFDCEPEYNRLRNRTWKKRNRKLTDDPVKVKVRDMVKIKIRQGLIIPQSCEVCGKKGQSHHHDYIKPFDIRWLCSLHHGEQHRTVQRAT